MVYMKILNGFQFFIKQTHVRLLVIYSFLSAIIGFIEADYFSLKHYFIRNTWQHFIRKLILFLSLK